MQRRDSLGYTIGVAAVLCVVCSLAVSAAAVALRPIQDANAKLDQQKNILDAAGLAIGEYGMVAAKLDKSQIDELYGWVSEELIDLETGEVVTDQNPADWNLMEASQDPKKSVAIVDPEYDPGEDRRQKISKVFYIKRPGSENLQQVVLPIHGKGLWGTLYGYLAIKSDLRTIQGITFYQHKETPGLGGEVDNASWKAQWEGLKLYDDDGEPAAYVYKGTAPAGSDYAVDGLSGATITCRGVTNFVRYWASDDGYGPYLAKLNERIESGDPLGVTYTESDASVASASGDDSESDTDTVKDGE